MTAVTRLLMVRHGQSTWNADGRWQGHADAPLSVLGEAQAAAAAEAIGDIDVVVASDLARARRTAEIIADALGVGPALVDARLRERDAGAWTGLTRHEIEQRWPGHLAEWRTPDGFELDQQLLVRVVDAVLDLHAQFPGQHVLAVAHGGVLRALDRRHGIHDEHFPNLGGRRFTLGGEPVEISVGERVSLLQGRDVVVTTPTQI
ncbi:MAG TPA: histidine phosphatase family protein [Acidimicrobiales bacterium]|jgi:broad specificity phosphatase PhoE|nr:histidine phosphatase family protein [Acidimicrobiales bacterium]